MTVFLGPRPCSESLARAGFGSGFLPKAFEYRFGWKMVAEGGPGLHVKNP